MDRCCNWTAGSLTVSKYRTRPSLNPVPISTSATIQSIKDHKVTPRTTLGAKSISSDVICNKVVMPVIVKKKYRLVMCPGDRSTSFFRGRQANYIWYGGVQGYKGSVLMLCDYLCILLPEVNPFVNSRLATSSPTSHNLKTLTP